MAAVSEMLKRHLMLLVCSKILFYFLLQELCGLTVKLLGSPSDHHEVPSLGRIIDLVDASSKEVLSPCSHLQLPHCRLW